MLRPVKNCDAIHLARSQSAEQRQRSGTDRQESRNWYASDLNTAKHESLSTETGFCDLISSANDFVEGRTRGRVLAMILSIVEQRTPGRSVWNGF
jgi:hypothetical protein